ncbi:MAG TPA: hypothetical protein VFA43_08715 [Gemmatimonadaceae bacterium]|nr:hypothetical protein [Gemmatimonadaceae bacterium]
MKTSAVLTIVAGGLIAGTIDIGQAYFFFGSRVPLGIAAALIGKAGMQATPVAGAYVLGLVLHYIIATTWTAAYYAASRRLTFLTEHPVVCGLVYGLVVECVMSYVVLPLSALHATGPYELHDVLLGLGVHMVTIGLPIALTVSWLGRGTHAVPS